MSPDAMLKQALFEAARHLSTLEERRAYLDRACADDPALRRQIEALIELEGPADEFFRDTHSPDPAAIGGLDQKVVPENRQRHEGLDANTGELNALKPRLADLDPLLANLNRPRD